MSGTTKLQNLPAETSLQTGSSADVPQTVLTVACKNSCHRLIYWTLEKENIDIQRARTSAEAMQLIHTERPDLIIVSTEMKGFDGIEFLQKIRQEFGFRLVPVIMITGSAPEDRVRAISAGANQVFTEPLNPRELIAAVYSEIERNRFVLEMIIHDTLTGAYSRRYIFERLREELQRYRRNNEPLCVAILDLDLFKRVNDTYGHLAGDEILRRFVAFLKNGLRSYDTIGRYGGEEFIVLMPNTSPESALSILDRVRADWADTPQNLGSNIVINITFSGGIGIADLADLEPEDIILRADQALYKAKSEGRNRLYTESA